MKIGIIYATNRKKATLQLVLWLEESLISKGWDVVVGKPAEYNDFDCSAFIIGSAVYGGSVKDAGILPFLDKNINKLKNKPLALFVVCKGMEYADERLGDIEEKFKRPPVLKKAFSGYMIFSGGFRRSQKSEAETWAEDIIRKFGKR